MSKISSKRVLFSGEKILLKLYRNFAKIDILANTLKICCSAEILIKVNFSTKIQKKSPKLN